MRTSAEETPCARPRSRPGPTGASRSPPPPALSTGILGREVSVLGLVRFAKVALLHHGRQRRHVRDRRLGRGRIVVLLEDLHVLYFSPH